MKTLKLLGITLHDVTVDELHGFIGRKIEAREKAVIPYLNIHAANLACAQPWLRDYFNRAALVICDGDGIRWGLRLLGQSPPPKITYDRWIWQLAAFSAARGYRIYLLGAAPGIAEKAQERLKAKFPALQVCGVHHGHFHASQEENEKVLADIQRCRPDILLVGFGMPLQEKWLLANGPRLDAPVILTGGAALDYAAGAARRAPAWAIRLHLEWLFRLLQEPKRLFRRYALGIPLFFWRIVLERIRGSI
ncbi:MAG: WecB/TagA/CpsF family glycosyltransferase [Candidatus Omnitrophota bacterium]